MNREDLLALCARWTGAGDRMVAGRASVTTGQAGLVPEIMWSFRRAEISESEKNALLALVCDPEEVADCRAETACVRDPWADEHVDSADDD